MDKVFIRDLSVKAIIGIYDWERQKPQEILINVTLYNNQFAAGESDQIVDCVNYAEIAEKLRRHTEAAQRFTVEALAADLAQLCLQTEGVKKVIVRVEKPGAVPTARSVGVEIKRKRPDYRLKPYKKSNQEQNQ